MKTLLALLLLLGLAACKDDDKRDRLPRPPAAPVVPAAPADPGTIDFRSLERTTENPQNAFLIPRCGEGKLGYVVTGWPAPISGTMVMAYRIDASADAVIKATEGTGSPRVTLYLQRRGDDWSAKGKYAAYRWYSRHRKGMAPGTRTYSEPLTHENNWSPAESNSYNTAANFIKALQNVENVGFVFGGGNVGHGVCMQAGSASFTVLDFKVQ